ncbi:LysR family transcriptional regulator [Pseudomonas sp. NPDC096917]|uniref:LysR family transcriptional regulator n=1 Tax=Pseudomonas sp. NPDC096917 TaxID=3364483 RepID=UPI00383B13E1
MNQLLAIRAFCCIVDNRGLSAAAEAWETTPSTMSRHLQHLETELGVRLINRTTRQLSLTEAGERYYAACVDILQRLDQAALAVADHGDPSGTLRISAPLVIGTLELMHWLPAFQQRYPKIQIDLSCEDRFVDLVAERFDVALRISGPLDDSSLVAKTLTVSELILVASPGYVARHGLPRQVDELSHHQLLMFGANPEWRLNSARGDAVTLALKGRFRTDIITSLHSAVLAGMGIAAFTRATVQPHLQNGQLVHILPDYHAGQRHYYALYPHARHLARKVRAFVEFMTQYYKAK